MLFIRRESTAEAVLCHDSAQEQVSLKWSARCSDNPTKEMKLVVFDLDGTLTTTFAVDVQCFVQAFSIALGIHDVNTNWAGYRYVTDSGVVLEAFRNAYGRDPDPSEVSRFIDCFVSLLTEAYSTGTDSFGEIAGARGFLAYLQQHSQWCAAIATGGWKGSARFKMTAAGINADGIPAAFAEDGPAREVIVEAAIRKASLKYGSRFERIVLVGDAIWDVWTAQRLQLPFVGLGSGERAALLRNAGATAVIENFLDYEHCLECFEDAAIPTLDGRSISGQG
jgi:phosphoglycolate phosphatase-like HAD superfamily hydrolase